MVVGKTPIESTNMHAAELYPKEEPSPTKRISFKKVSMSLTQNTSKERIP